MQASDAGREPVLRTGRWGHSGRKQRQRAEEFLKLSEAVLACFTGRQMREHPVSTPLAARPGRGRRAVGLDVRSHGLARDNLTYSAIGRRSCLRKGLAQ